MNAKFKAPDLTNVIPGQRSVLEINFSSLLRLYCQAKPAKREDLRRYRLKKWHQSLGAIPAWDIHVEHIDAIVKAMEEQGLAGSTINRAVADVGGCYSWAIMKRHCPEGFHNPCREFQARVDTPRVVELNDDQIDTLLAAARLSSWPKLYALVLAALHTAGRKSELLGLAWSDIDTHSRRANLHTTKNGKPRRLLLTPQVLSAIEAVRPRPCPEDALVFSGRNLFRPHNFRKSWERCRIEAGLPGLHFHDLRHVACARMLKSGVNIHAAANVLGHGDTRMISQRYGHLDDDHLQIAVDNVWTEV